MVEIIYLVQDEAYPQGDLIRLMASSTAYGPSIKVLHPTTNETMAMLSLDYFENQIQVLCFALLPDGSASEEVTSKAVLIEDYQDALHRDSPE